MQPSIQSIEQSRLSWLAKGVGVHWHRLFNSLRPLRLCGDQFGLGRARLVTATPIAQWPL